MQNRSSKVFILILEIPRKKYSKKYQSGALSFEYFVDGTKIITNCGFGDNISPKAELISD